MLTKSEMNSILRWSHVTEKVEWGTIAIQGAWNVLAKITFTSESGKALTTYTKTLGKYNEKTILLILMSITWGLTQFCDTITITSQSIVVIANALKGKNSLKNNPIHLLLPVALIARMSFLLPESQTCGLLISQKYHIKTRDFFKAGLFPTALSFIAIYIQSITLTPVIFKKIDALHSEELT